MATKASGTHSAGKDLIDISDEGNANTVYAKKPSTFGFISVLAFVAYPLFRGCISRPLIHQSFALMLEFAIFVFHKYQKE
jgi:hypothetical protein